MEDELADIYYVDTRNADHRTGRSLTRPTWGGRSVYVQHPQAPARPVVYGTPGPVVYGAPAPQSPVSAILGRLTTGQVLEMVAMVVAAILPLPPPPSTTDDVGTDVSNVILYQEALAKYSRSKAQLDTLGHVVARLVA